LKCKHKKIELDHEKIFFLLLIFVLTACGSSAPTVEYPNLDIAPKDDHLGKAPELTNEIWLNTDHPLRLADLHGQVVLLEMWTFG